MSYLAFIDPGNSGGSVVIPEFPRFILKPVVYECVICGAPFGDRDGLFQHRFETHPFRRPSLLVCGKEITSPRHIVVRPLRAEDISLAYTTKLTLDGIATTPERLIEVLGTDRRTIRSVVLENEGVSTAFELQFDIPEHDHLCEVERLFFALFAKATVDVMRIDAFIDITKDFHTALRYVDGISQYLYGILAKDQGGGTHLPQADYKIKFNQALDVLQAFDTALSDVLVGVINFNQNAFDEGSWLDHAPKLKIAMSRFSQLLGGHPVISASSPIPVASAENIPLDTYTDQIIRWSTATVEELSTDVRKLKHVIHSPNWTPDDRFKVRVLLAEMYLASGDESSARTCARHVANDAIFGSWAQGILARTESPK
jgi:hypothetical protein